MGNRPSSTNPCDKCKPSTDWSIDPNAGDDCKCGGKCKSPGVQTTDNYNEKTGTFEVQGTGACDCCKQQVNYCKANCTPSAGGLFVPKHQLYSCDQRKSCYQKCMSDRGCEVKSYFLDRNIECHDDLGLTNVGVAQVYDGPRKPHVCGDYIDYQNY